MDIETRDAVDDAFDRRLARAGREPVDDPDVRSALSRLVADRTQQDWRTKKRGRVIPAVTVGGLLALAGAGTAVATQWGPWAYVPDPDIVVVKDWYDVHGTYLGSCEGRLKISNFWDADTLASVRQAYESVDVDALEPEPPLVAGGLASLGELERIGDLIPGATPSDFPDIHNSPTPVADPMPSDARILQAAFMNSVYRAVYDAGADPKISFAGEDQCTTDPPAPAQQ